MKKILTITFIVAATFLGATLVASVIPKLKPAKQELPEVVINGVSSGTRGYTANVSVEIASACPRENANYKADKERYDFYFGGAEGATVFVRHCERCNIGVYSQHANEEESVKRCTYCGNKEPEQTNP